MRSHLTAVLAAVFVRAALSPAVAAPAAPDEIVFDLAPLPITTVLHEVLFASVQPGLVVDARIEAVFLSEETDPWLVSVGFALPTGGDQFLLDPTGTSGVGRFVVDFHTQAFDGLLAPPDGLGSYTGFASVSAAAAAPSGDLLGPVDGLFTTLRLTLFLAPCPFGDPEAPWTELAGALAGSAGTPHLAGSGSLCAGEAGLLTLTDAVPRAAAALVLGLQPLELPVGSGLLVPRPDLVLEGLATDALGSARVPFSWPAGPPAGTASWLQVWIVDPGAPFGLSATNGLLAVVP